MRTRSKISSRIRCTKTNIQDRQNEPQASASHGSQITPPLRTQCGTDDRCGQRNTIGQIRRLANRPSGDAHNDFIADSSTTMIVSQIGFRTCTKHLRQILSATPTLFMAPPTSTGLNLNQGSRPLKGTHNGAYFSFIFRHDYQRRSGAISSKGRNLAATASRALKIRERTVPIGQSIMLAISS